MKDNCYNLIIVTMKSLLRQFIFISLSVQSSQLTLPTQVQPSRRNLQAVSTQCSNLISPTTEVKLEANIEARTTIDLQQYIMDDGQVLSTPGICGETYTTLDFGTNNDLVQSFQNSIVNIAPPLGTKQQTGITGTLFLRSFWTNELLLTVPLSLQLFNNPDSCATLVFDPEIKELAPVYLGNPDASPDTQIVGPLEDILGLMASCSPDIAMYELIAAPSFPAGVSIDQVVNYNKVDFSITPIASNLAINQVYEFIHRVPLGKSGGSNYASIVVRMRTLAWPCSLMVAAECQQNFQVYGADFMKIPINPVYDAEQIMIGFNCGQNSYVLGQIVSGPTQQLQLDPATGTLTLGVYDQTKTGTLQIIVKRIFTVFVPAVEFACSINIEILDPCYSMKRTPTTMAQCVLLGVKNSVQLPKLIDDSQFLQTRDDMCGSSTYSVGGPDYTALTSILPATSVDTPPQLNVVGLVAGQTYTLTYSRSFNLPNLTAPVVIADTLVISINDSSFVFAGNATILTTEPKLTLFVPYRALTLDYAMLQCQFSMDRPNELPADFNLAFSSQEEFVQNAYAWVLANNNLQFDTTAVVSSLNAEAATLTQTPSGYRFFTQVEDDFTISQKTNILLNGSNLKTIEEVSWTIHSELQLRYLPPISLIAWIGLEMKFDLSPLVKTFTFEIQGPILSCFESIEGNVLLVGLHDRKFLKLFEGTLTVLERGFSTSISLEFKNPFKFVTGNTANFDYVWGTSMNLSYLEVGMSSNIQALQAELHLLKQNLFYLPLYEAYTKQTSTAEQVMWPEFTAKYGVFKLVHTITADKRSSPSLAAFDASHFTFKVASVTDNGKTISLTQTTAVYYGSRLITYLSAAYGLIQVSSRSLCYVTTLQNNFNPKDMVVFVNQPQEQFYKNVTDSLGLLADKQAQCGPSVVRLVLSGTGQDAPDFFSLYNSFIKVAPTELHQVGKYSIDLQTTYPLFDLSFVQTFIVSIVESVPSIIPQQKVNKPPYFKNTAELPAQQIQVSVPFAIMLPKIIDDEGDKVTVTTSFSNSDFNKYMQFALEKNSLLFRVPQDLLGHNEQVYLTMSDGSLFNTYYFDVYFTQGYVRIEEVTDDLALENQELAKQYEKLLVDEFLLGQQSQVSQQTKLRQESEKSCVPEKIEAFPDGTILLTFRSEINLKDSPSLVQQIKASKSIQLQLIKADSDSPFSDFDWTMKAPNSFSLKLTLTFLDPGSISSTNRGRDILIMTFKDTSKFLSCPQIPQNRQLAATESIPKDFEIFVKLPMLKRIADGSDQKEPSEEVLDIVATSDFKAVVCGSMVTNYIVGFSASYIWGGINALQLITTTALFKVTIPDDVKPLFSYLKAMTRFDMFYDIFNPIEYMNYTKTDPFNEQFDDLGLSSVNYFDVLGSMTVIFAITALTQVVAPLLLLCARCTGLATRKCFKKFVDQNEFMRPDRYSVVNTWVRLILETYMDMLIAAVLALESPLFISLVSSSMNNWDKFNYWVAVGTIALLGLFTLLLLYLVCCRFRLPVRKEKTTKELQDIRRLSKYYLDQVKKRVLHHEEIEKAQARAREVDPFFQEEPMPVIQVGELEPPIQVIDEASQPDRLSKREHCIEEEYSGGSQEESNGVGDEASINEDEEEKKEAVQVESPSRVVADENVVALIMNRQRIMPYTGPLILKPQFLSVDEESKINVEDSKNSLNMVESNRSNNSSFASSCSSPDNIWAEGSKQSQRLEFDSLSANKKGRTGQKALSEMLPLYATFEEVKCVEKIASQKTSRDKLIKSLSQKTSNQYMFSTDSIMRSNFMKSQTLVLADTVRGANYRILLQEQVKLRQKLRVLQKQKERFNIEYVSSLRDGLRPGSQEALFYHLLFLARRILLIVSTVLLTEKVTATVLVLLFVFGTKVTMIYSVAVYPLETYAENRLEIFNEFFVYWVAIHHLVMLALHFDHDQLQAFGTSLYVSIGIMVGVNLFLNYACTVMGLFHLLKKLISSSRASIRTKPKKQKRKETDYSIFLDIERPHHAHDQPKGQQTDREMADWYKEAYGQELASDEEHQTQRYFRKVKVKTTAGILRGKANVEGNGTAGMASYLHRMRPQRQIIDRKPHLVDRFYGDYPIATVESHTKKKHNPRTQAEPSSRVLGSHPIATTFSNEQDEMSLDRSGGDRSLVDASHISLQPRVIRINRDSKVYRQGYVWIDGVLYIKQ